jgi:hypothetical protein
VFTFETPSNIKQSKMISGFLAHDERLLGPGYRICKCICVITATPDVKTDSDNVQAQLNRLRQKSWNGNQRCSKFESQSAQAFRVVREDSQHELCTGVGARDLVQFIDVIKRRHVDTQLRGVFNERGWLAWVCKDNSVGVYTQPSHHFDLIYRSAIESGAEGRKQSKNYSVGICLHG